MAAALKTNMKLLLLITFLTFTSAVNAEEYYVFSVEKMNFLHNQSRSHFLLSPPYWQPDESSINEAFVAIKKYIAIKSNNQSQKVLTKYDTYNFQIFGYSEDDSKLIYINAFCEDKPYWQTGFVRVMDGGSCYWQATYNPVTKTLISFYSNGYA